VAATPTPPGIERSGDRVAAAFHRTFTHLVRTATLLTGDRAVAERIVRRAYVVVLRHRRLEGDALDEALLAEVVDDSLAFCVRGPRGRDALPRTTPTSSVTGDPEADEIVAALWSLSPIPRACVVLRHWAGLDDDGVSAAVGRREAAVQAALDTASGAIPPDDPRVRATLDRLVADVVATPRALADVRAGIRDRRVRRNGTIVAVLVLLAATVTAVLAVRSQTDRGGSEEGSAGRTTVPAVAALHSSP
jgi:DNA-directed RNA polymerase specialized sigma24 family protein